MTVRKPEDLTLEEVRKQMALYQRLCYHKVKEPQNIKTKLDDGLPESVEEQGLLLLVWRRNIRNDI